MNLRKIWWRVTRLWRSPIAASKGPLQFKGGTYWYKCEAIPVIPPPVTKGRKPSWKAEDVREYYRFALKSTPCHPVAVQATAERFGLSVPHTYKIIRKLREAGVLGAAPPIRRRRKSRQLTLPLDQGALSHG